MAEMRRAVVMAEILAPPKALRRFAHLGRYAFTGPGHAPNLRQG